MGVQSLRKMYFVKKICIFTVVLCYLISCTAHAAEIMYGEDRPYDPIEIKIPLEVWKKAINPTPILKSVTTITIPVHVSSEYLENDEEDNAEEINEVEDPPLEENQEIAQVVTEPPLSDVTLAVQSSPVIQTEQATVPTQTQIFGQVLRAPCSCVDGQCGCCTGMLLQRFQMNACSNISFIPEDFVFDVRMSVNNNTVIRRRVSASDPPPICFNLRRLPFVRVCAEISNIRIRNRNAFACLDINADIAEFPVYSASFRCFGLGTSGVQTGLKPKPDSAGPEAVSLFGGGNAGDSDGPTFIQNAASNILGGGQSDGLLDGIASGIFGGESDGPLGAIGDAIGNVFDRE